MDEKTQLGYCEKCWSEQPSTPPPPTTGESAVTQESVAPISRYVVGFMFNPERTHVALIRKNKPKWQAGLLNGIGGKIEDFDTSPKAAMIREFEEEAGVTTEWKSYAAMLGPDWSVECFATHGDLSELVSKTDEKIEVSDVANLLRRDMIENLPWLIAMAVDFLEDGRPQWAAITYP